MMARAIAYMRVSTEDQVQSGAGLMAQRDACQRWAETQGVELATVHTDEGISGACGLDKRPGLLEAIAALNRGDVLVVAKRDRLGRDPIAVAMIESAVLRKGGRVVSAQGEGTDSDDPTSILMRRMVDAFAEYERLIIGARTRAALQAKKIRGERVGKIPYGYVLAEDGVHLVDYPEEQKVQALVRELRADGMSWRSIAAELNNQGLTNRLGRKWNHQNLMGCCGAACP